MDKLLSTLKELVPWAIGLSFWPKILLSSLIIGLAVLLVLLIWLPNNVEKKSPDEQVNIPITEKILTSDEAIFLKEIRDDKYIDVPLSSFFKLAVLSWQITESELDAFVKEAISVLHPDHDYFIDGGRESVSIKGGGEIFIYRTGNKTYFKNAQSGALLVLECISSLRDGDNSKCKDLHDVKIKIRGKERFFDIEGLQGVSGRTWVGFDLRG